jgi:hypothetical protein
LIGPALIGPRLIGPGSIGPSDQTERDSLHMWFIWLSREPDVHAIWHLAYPWPAGGWHVNETKRRADLPQWRRQDVTMTWIRCHGYDAMVTMPWLRCHGYDAMVTMPWLRCHGINMTKRWLAPRKGLCWPPSGGGTQSTWRASTDPKRPGASPAGGFAIPGPELP